ncbi:MAG: hypothetical protein HYT80_05280 [Euryarchaeota archaeon]|nr:hypothetical protein [Euryarchaeota archaeon]
MAKARPKPSTDPVGPGRWGYRVYNIVERPTPRGRRYEIHTPERELVAACRIRKDAQAISFFADTKESQEIVFEVVDSQSGRPIGEFRKKVYPPLGKSEWFIFNPDGDPVGMVTETASDSWVGRLLSMGASRPRAFDLHWGQAIGGKISRRRMLLGLDHTQVDLSLDKKDVIDRRLALGLAVLVRDDETNGDRSATVARAAKPA